MDTPKNLYKVNVTTVVGDLTYEAGQTYELTEEQAVAFAEGEIELVATPDTVPSQPESAPEGDAPVVPDAAAEGLEVPAPEAEPVVEEAAPEAAKPWAGNHQVGRE